MSTKNDWYWSLEAAVAAAAFTSARWKPEAHLTRAQ